MAIKFYKTDRQSVIPKVYSHDGRYYLCLTMVSAFPLDDPGNLLDEGEPWGVAGDALKDYQTLDALMPKARGEFLVQGKCYSPAGQPVEGLKVEVKVGGITKQLNVFGDRVLNLNGNGLEKLGPPKPFVEMDLSYENAFGGPGFAPNPLGKGFDGGNSQGAPLDLPNIQMPDKYWREAEKDLTPAGLGPIGVDWAQRQQHTGTYDQNWLDKRWPWFPDDFNWAFFNAAPPDQWPAGYFIGDEPIAIRNMHPSIPLIQSRLPGVRTRCFIQRRQGEFDEPAANPDTVWLFPDRLVGAMIWRAVIQTMDDEASDIQAALIAIEELREPRRPLEYYREVFEQASKPAPPIEAKAEAPEPPGEPEVPLVVPIGTPELDPADQAMLDEMNKDLAEQEQMIAGQLKEAGIDPTALEHPGMDAITEPAPLLGGEPDIAQLMQEADAELAQLEAIAKEAGLDPTAMAMPEPTAGMAKMPDMSVAEIAALIKETGIQDVSPDEIIKVEQEIAEQTEQVEAMLAAEQAEVEEKPAAAPAVIPPPTDVQPLTRDDVLARIEQRQSLAGWDLTGLNLSGLNMTDLDLSASILEKCDLSGCILNKANLAGAVLAQSIMNKVDLSGALLAEANLSNVKAENAKCVETDFSNADATGSDFAGADFTGACINSGVFDQGHFRGACFDNVTARQASFVEADFTGADFKESNLARADFSKAKLDRADFSRANLDTVTFDGAGGNGVHFLEADLTASRADDQTHFPGGDFQGVNMTKAYWEGAALMSANFHKANIDRADFTKCRLNQADFYRAKARQTKFTKADLSEANMVSINLFRGDLTKARLVSTILKGANLFECEFLNATLGQTNLVDANLKRTKIEKKADQ